MEFAEDYVNEAVETALDALAATPGESTLAALLDAAQRGGLVLDVTGSTPESGPRVRTVASTDGHPVLPLFTSLAQVELAVGQALAQAAQAAQGAQPQASAPAEVPVQGVIVPARRALELIASDHFVAVQFNPGQAAQVIARRHVEMALHGGTDS